MKNNIFKYRRKCVVQPIKLPVPKECVGPIRRQQNYFRKTLRKIYVGSGADDDEELKIILATSR